MLSLPSSVIQNSPTFAPSDVPDLNRGYYWIVQRVKKGQSWQWSMDHTASLEGACSIAMLRAQGKIPPAPIQSRVWVAWLSFLEDDGWVVYSAHIRDCQIEDERNFIRMLRSLEKFRIEHKIWAVTYAGVINKQAYYPNDGPSTFTNERGDTRTALRLISGRFWIV